MAVSALLLLSLAASARPAPPVPLLREAPVPPDTPAAELNALLRPGEETSWPLDRKLALADPSLRLEVVLDRLAGRGFQPRVAFTWRSLLTQDWLLSQGRSKVSFSFHNAVEKGGYPAALAADLFDARWGWGDGAPDSESTRLAAGFFQSLGEEAERLGLRWGGRFTQRNVWAGFGMGWDPAHIQSRPDGELPRVRNRSLRALLGRPRIVHGSGGYVYAQFHNGYLQVLRGPALRGHLILPGNAAWQAITAEVLELVGPLPAAPTPRTRRWRRRSA